MRDLNYLNINRINFFGQGNEHNGAFELKIKGEKYMIVASDGFGWEHVSISHAHKIPSWSVMCIVKDMFFEESETVMQLHVAKDKYINLHNNCLHLWKPVDKEIPTPQLELV